MRAIRDILVVGITALLLVLVVADCAFAEAVAIYSFDSSEVSGNVAGDSSGNDFDGAIAPGVVAGQPGKFGEALYFGGSNSEVQASAPYTFGNRFSISFWLKTADLAQFQKYLVFHGTIGTNQNAIIYGYSPNTVQFYAPASSGPSATAGIIAGSDIVLSQAGAWTNIIYTYDGSRFRGYLNGVQVVDIAAAFSLNATGPLYIGSPSQTFPSGNYVGLIDDVGIFDTALSPAQVTLLQTHPVATLNTWSLTHAMNTPRIGHSATVLGDNRVLVVGGNNSNSFVASAEIYDPATGTWSFTGEMSAPRVGHSATLLSDGRVLVFGGFSGVGQFLTSAEIYEPATGTWSVTGSMNMVRNGGAATLLSDGRVLVAGGSNATFQVVEASAEIYDPTTGLWSLTTSMNLPRSSHTATLLSDGRILVAGGAGSSAVEASAEIYNPTTTAWSLTDSMSTARANHRAIRLSDGQVLVAGGKDGSFVQTSDAEIYHPATGTWSSTGSMITSRDRHSATLLPDGRVLVAGGDNGGMLQDAAELYDPTTGAWSVTGSMSTPHANHTASLLPGGWVLVSGGTSGNAVVLAIAEVFAQSAGFDTTPPQIVCGEADGAWHKSDVTISCRASDPESGLASAADSAFDLTTNTPSGTETANAITTHRDICNVDGKCATAGPIGGNKVDKKPPVISIITPAPNATYLLHATVAAEYVCSDGGAGVASCQGPAANGAAIDTGSFGPKTFSVTAVDSVGNVSTETVAYWVRDPSPPRVACGTSDGLWHNDDVAIPCTASDPESGLVNEADAAFVLTTNTAEGIETASADTNSRQICNAEGNCVIAGPISGNKIDKKPPTITITSPTATTYQLNALIASNYACVDAGSGLATCQGTAMSGTPIDTSSAGTKTFTVTSTDNVGRSTTRTVTYSVMSGGGGGSTSADLRISSFKAQLSNPSPTEQQITYSIEAVNLGKATATDVVVDTAVPTGTAFATASTSHGALTVPAIGGSGPVTVNVGSLPNAGKVTIGLIVIVTAPSKATITNTASVGATTQDLNSANNTASVSTKVK